jgi:uncharacterized protein (TIGR00369 family)
MTGAAPGAGDKELQDNPTRRYIWEAVRRGDQELSLDFSPLLRPYNTILVKGAPGRVTLRYEMGADMVQGAGYIGGGMIANILDMTMAVAMLSMLQPGQHCATINLSVNMIAAAVPGYLFTSAEVERLGRRTGYTRAEVRDNRDRLIASAISSLLITGV